MASDTPLTGGNHIKDTICSLLKDAGMWYDYFEHDEVITAEAASQIRENYTLAEGSKALILRLGNADEKRYIQVVVPGNTKFSNAKVRKLLGEKNIQLVSPDILKTLTGGILPGGVPPFGTLFNIPVYVDTNVINKEKMVFNCGLRSASIGMKTEDYVTLVKPIIADLSVAATS